MKRLLTVAIMVVITASTLTGCYGKFNLTRKVYEVNSQVHEKFLRSGLTWLLMPIYGMAGMVDFIFFNTVEFWSGSNPIVFGEKDFQYAKGEDTFKIHASKSGDTINYKIKHFNKVCLVDTTFISCNSQSGKTIVSTSKNGITHDFIASNNDGRIRVDQYANGTVQDIIWFTQADKPLLGSTL